MTNNRCDRKMWTAILLATFAAALGCHSGVYPFVYHEWREDEAYTVTVHEQIAELRSLRQSAHRMSAAEQHKQLDVMGRLMERAKNPVLSIEIVHAAARFSIPEADLLLRTALTSGDEDVRVAVCNAWGERRGERAVDGLLEAYRDAAIDVRMAAVRALGNHKEMKAVSVLAQAIEDANPAIQHRAIKSLQAVTGKNFGQDLPAWRAYLQRGGYSTAARQPTP